MKFHIYQNDAEITTVSDGDSALTKASDGTYSYVVTGLTAGVKYSFSISADNGEGEGTRSAAVDVTTSDIGVTSVTLTIAKTAHVGDTLTAQVTIVPPDATDQHVTYSVNDTKLASISTDGTLTCIAPGTITVTAAADGGQKATATVTIYEVMVSITNLAASNITTTSATLNWDTEAVKG